MDPDKHQCSATAAPAAATAPTETTPTTEEEINATPASELSLIPLRMGTPFMEQTMLTCIGNKRKLVPYIRGVFEEVRKRTRKDKLKVMDGFTGSTVVSRMLTYISSELHSNDLQPYSYLMARCFLETPSREKEEIIKTHITRMNLISDDIFTNPTKGFEGIISKGYAPKDTKNIQDGERCFYTRENALIIDTLRRYIEDTCHQSEENTYLFPYLIAPSYAKQASTPTQAAFSEHSTRKTVSDASVVAKKPHYPASLDKSHSTCQSGTESKTSKPSATTKTSTSY